jgi:DNA-binding transcriptional regulator GbsR (MarR family)
MENSNNSKKIKCLINEVRRYEIIADYFKKYPKRLTDKNKDYLEEILYRLYDVQGEQLPAQIKDICTRIQRNLSSKLDLI